MRMMIKSDCWRKLSLVLVVCLIRETVSFVTPLSSTASTTNLGSSWNTERFKSSSHHHCRGRVGGSSSYSTNSLLFPAVALNDNTIQRSVISLNGAATTSSGGGAMNEVREDDDGILRSSVGVGMAAAGLGFVYGKAMGFSQNALWVQLPKMLTAKMNRSINPLYFITGMCTAGGLIVGLLSAKFQDVEYTAADFVSAFSSSASQTQLLPQSRLSLFPLLLLSLTTSAFGFSLGPEAPMVCAGSLLGASIGRKIYASSDDNNDNKEQADKSRNKKIATLAYCGAAGTLTAFMGIPIAGSIFALEMTRSSAGFASEAREALSPAIAASLAALVVLRGVLIPNASIAGHFDYGIASAVSGRSMIIASLTAGLGGALLGTVFHKVVHVLKATIWKQKQQTMNDGKSAAVGYSKGRKILTKTLIGLVVGLLSSKFPQTLFWGEGSLQCAIDGQKTAFAATKHGLSPILTSIAAVNPSLPFATPFDALQVGLVKLFVIMIACAGKFPGGIIFPLFFAAAPFAHAFSSVLGPTLLPMFVMSLMSATQSAVTRTPMASALILSLTSTSSTALSTMLPACLLASYVSVWASQWLSSKAYFQYSETTTDKS